MADLPRDGREYFRWPIIIAPADVQFEAQIAGEWVDASRTTDTITLYLEGPDVAVADHDVAAHVLPKSQQIRFRVKDTEIVIRKPGWVRLVD